MIQVLLVLNLLAGALLATELRGARRRLQRAWSEVAEIAHALGLREPAHVGPEIVASGTLDALPVEVRVGRGGAGELHWQLHVATLGLDPLRARPGSCLSSAPASEVDPDLARRCDVDASADTLLAGLGGGGREALLALVEDGWTVDTADAEGPAGIRARRHGSGAGAVEAAGHLVLLAGLLVQAAPLAPRLAARMQQERRTGIRVACLDLLQELVSGGDHAQQALRAARDDGEEPLRRAAVRHLHAAGAPITTAEAELMMSGGRSEDQLIGLARADADVSESAVLRCLRTDHGPVIEAACAWLERHGTRLCMAELQRTIDRPLLPRSIRGAAEHARSTLLDRLGGDARAGGLAVVDAAPARLSFAAAAQAGSVAFEEPGATDAAPPPACEPTSGSS